MSFDPGGGDEMPWRYLFVTSAGGGGPSHPAARIFGPVFIAAGNALAWAQDFDAGKLVSALTVLVVGAVGIYVYALGKLTEARNKAFAERKRIELELEKEAEAARKDSLVAKLDAQNEQMERLRKSLHAQRDESNAAELKRAADMEDLRDQLKLAVQASADAYAELHEVRDQNRKLMAQNAALIDQNKELSRQLADLKMLNEGLARKVEGVATQVDANKAEIKTQAAQISRITTPDPDTAPAA